MSELSVRYGLKCARILEISTITGIKELVPATYPLDVSAIDHFLSSLPEASPLPVTSVERFIKDQSPTLVEDIRRTCGNFPWIIRSSGEEDSDNYSNAGGFESRICDREDQFYHQLAHVVLSGRKQKARQQSAYLGIPSTSTSRAVPAFVQPLIQSTEPSFQAEPGEIPYFQNSSVYFLKQTIAALHHHFRLPTLDCEWVAETDYGLVSATSLSTVETPAHVSGQVAFGFHLFSTQHVQEQQNSICYWIPEEGPDIWQGNRFRAVEVRRWFLLQVRPAGTYRFLTTTQRLTQACKDILLAQDWLPVSSLDTILTGKYLRAGAFIKETTLTLAWQRYLNMPSEARVDVSAILVEHGTRTEHAGIMFAQTELPVLRMDLTQIPAQANVALADPVSAQVYFHIDPAASHTVLSLEQCDQLMLAHNCLSIFPPVTSPEDTIFAHMLPSTDFRAAGLAQIPDLEALQLSALLSPETKERLLDHSLYPTPEFLISSPHFSTSPTLFARTLEGFFARQDMKQQAIEHLLSMTLPATTRHFLYAWLATKEQFHLEQQLPLLRQSQPQALLRLLKQPDLVFYWKLLTWEQSVGDIPSAVLGKLLECAANDLDNTSSTAAVQARFTALLALQKSMHTLSIYTSLEVQHYFQQFIEIMQQTDEHMLTICIQLCQDRFLPAHQALRLLAHAHRIPGFFTAREEFVESISQISLILIDLHCAGRPQELNAAYQQLSTVLSTDDQLQDCLSSFFHALVECYDVTAKELLLRLVEWHDPATSSCYLDLLDLWLTFIQGFVKTKAPATFRQWIAHCKQQPQSIEDYFLAEVNWRTRVKEAEQRDSKELSLTNPHQLHNLLHQWSLSLAPVVSVASLPTFIQRMHHFATTFSEQENRIFRFQQDLFEIELPMTTHKASFVFRPDTIQIEFSEPPETADEKIARLVAFSAFYHKFNQWFPAFRFIHHYEKVAGSWTLFVTVKLAQTAQFSQETYWQAFALMRFLFDSAYHFSHEAVEEVQDIEQRFNEPEWRHIFADLINYRTVFDDSQQFTDLKLFALATFFTDLCRNPSLEKDLLHAHQQGFAFCVSKLQEQESILRTTQTFEQWRASYQFVRHLSLLISASWTAQTIAVLPLFYRFPFVGEIICCNLLKRSDIAKDVWTLFQQQVGHKESITFLYRMLLHYVFPLLLEHTTDINEIISFVSQTPGSYKRAKQYLLHRYVDQLDMSTASALIADVDNVPFGVSEKQERILEQLCQNKERFDIRYATSY